MKWLERLLLGMISWVDLDRQGRGGICFSLPGRSPKRMAQEAPVIGAASLPAPGTVTWGASTEGKEGLLESVHRS